MQIPARIIERLNGIEFVVLSEECKHLRVGAFDFWPSTGKFYNQKTKHKGRGVFNLMKLV